MSAAAKIEPGWFSIEGAAVYTGFSSRSIHNAIEAGRITPRRVAVSGEKKVPRLKREDLDAWIEADDSLKS